MTNNHTVGILETSIYPDGVGREFRVAVVPAIGRIYQSNSYLYNAFRYGEVFDTLLEAQAKAKVINKRFKCEHGIAVITDFADYRWDVLEHTIRKQPVQKNTNQNNNGKDCV